MAYFRTKFQIPSVASLKENGFQSLMSRSPTIIQSVLTKNSRSFWSRKSDNQPVEHGVGNCGKPLPPQMDLVSKGCPSKCLEFEKPRRGWRFFSIRKQSAVKEKPSNCKETENDKEEKKVEEELTLWEKIFGPNPKRSRSAPCTCKLVETTRKKMRDDPRLSDTRYQQTDGDVLLYTEMISTSKASCMEPQPKPPPQYKVPTAVVFKKLHSNYNMTMLNHMVDDHEMCEVKKDAHLETMYRIPYEEMRPPEKRRKPFSCKEGIQSIDVLPPMKSQLNYREILQHQQIHKSDLELPKQSSETEQNKSCEEKSSPDQMEQKRSRVEQLKILVKQKSTTR